MTQPNKPTGPVQLATLIGLGVLVVLNFMIWTQTRGFRRELNESFAKINTAMTAVTAKMEAAAQAAPQKPRGPDPNKVYTVNTNGAPSKGPASAPIVIAEFSDFQ